MYVALSYCHIAQHCIVLRDIARTTILHTEALHTNKKTQKKERWRCLENS